MDVWGQYQLHILVRAKTVADMCEISRFRLDLVYKLYGLIESEMGEVMGFLQSIQHKDLGSFHFFKFSVINVFGICDIGEIPEPKSKYG